MSALNEICSKVFVFTFFMVVFIFSANFANGLMYCAIFAVTILQKKYVGMLDVFIISIFWDIYSCSFIGITFVSAIAFFAITKKYRMTFRNFPNSIGYLLMSLCFSKSVVFALVNLIGYRFDINSNFMQILFALLIYTVYYFRVIMLEENSDA